MPLCYHCGKEVNYPFRCSFCNGQYCVEHRLPENHNCLNQPERTPLGRWRAKESSSEKLPKITISQNEKNGKKTTEEGEFYFVKGNDVGAKSKRPIKKIVAVMIVVIIIGLVLWNASTIISYFQNFSNSSTEEFDIHEEIAILNEDRDDWGKYRIMKYDWEIWKRQWDTSGGTSVKMDNWDDFKESLRQNSMLHC